MESIRILNEEHRVILRVIDAFETYAGEVERSGRVDRAEVSRFLTFFQEFTDVCHHGKEEDILFASLADTGFPTANGPVAAMREDHVRGRRLVRRIRELTERRSEWDTTEFELFAGVAHAYATLLRNHIRREDEVLYPMAEEHLAPEQRRQIDELFRLFEEQREKGLVHARLREMAEGLVARHGRPSTERRADHDRARRVPNCCGV